MLDEHHSGFRVIHLVRSVGPTSMPWNDLYGTGRLTAPGVMYPVIAVQRPWAARGFKWAENGAKRRRYLGGGPLAAMSLLLRLHRSCSATNRMLLLHVHNPSLALLAFLAKLLHPSVLVVCTQHNEWSGFRVWQRLSLSVLVRIAAVTVCVSKSISETIPPGVRRRLVQKNALRTIPNGIRAGDLDRDYPIEQLTERRTADVVVVARMVPQKNVFFVLRCFAGLQRAGNLIWFGDGVQRAELARYAGELGVSDRVRWCGVQPRAKVFEALRSSSIYLSCSKWEGIGVANLEAAALGCRPFLSEIAPHREIAGPLGLDTISLEDEAPWVKTMDDYLAKGQDVRVRNAQALARKARVEFDLDASVRAYIGVYRDVTERSRQAVE